MPSRVMMSIKKTPVPSTAMPATKVPLLHPFCVLSPRLVHSDLGNSRTKWSSIRYTISLVHLTPRAASSPGTSQRVCRGWMLYPQLQAPGVLHGNHCESPFPGLRL